jgi:tetratricopeptide (TPR) repeat protein
MMSAVRCLVRAMACGFLVVSPSEAQAQNNYENLKVLPADISRRELGDIMLANLSGLGLPRLAGEGCLFCHEGDLETPRREWDYASDAKPMKAKARVMLAMVRAINDEYLPQLESRVDADLRVTCETCHAGRTDPRPLPTVLWAAYEAGGMDSVETRYRVLRDRYFGGDAYDFRVGVLVGVAVRMANQGAIDDAIALAALNAEVYPDVPSSQRAWVQLRLERTVDAEGIGPALRELDELESGLRPDVLSPGLLNNLGWRLMRSDREDQAVALFEANYERFPDDYLPIESMAFIWSDSDRPERAFEILEEWLQKHPDHDRARQLLVNLRGR